MRRSVFIVGPKFGTDRMFLEEGWELAGSVKDADLLQFTGGEDVSPTLYGEAVHPRTNCNILRDKAEIKFYNMAHIQNIPMAGICRGAQFLNVMNGGKLWQDVNNHALNGTHEVFDLHNGRVYQATSTHHQMMKANPETSTLIAVAYESTKKEKMKDSGGVLTSFYGTDAAQDEEVVFYEESKCLCFQPHPEYLGHEELQGIYFDYIDDYLFPSTISERNKVCAEL